MKKQQHFWVTAYAAVRNCFRSKYGAYLNVLLSLTALLCVTGAFALLEPKVELSYYEFDNGERVEGEHPLLTKSLSSKLTAELRVQLSWLHPTSLYLKPDDCFESVTVNGKPLEKSLIDFCDYTHRGRLIPLGEFLHAGENVLQFDIRDTGGLTGVIVNPGTGGLYGWLYLSLVIATSLWLTYALAKLCLPVLSAPETGVLLFASAVRVFYFLSTPYLVRGHDTEAHIDYIKYVAKFLAIPPAAQGWEYHQAPLYYFVTGLWYAAWKGIGLPEETVMLSIKFFSLITSVLTVVILLWCARLLFPKKPQVVARTLLPLMASSIPGVVYLSTRIGNDALYVPLAFLSIALLLQWWHDGRPKTWWAFIVALSAGIVTKMSGLLYIPAAGILLLVRKGPLRAKLRTTGLSLLLGLLLVGWLPFTRLVLEHDPGKTLTLGNNGMSGNLRVNNGVENWFTFDPLQILLHPFNSPWEDSYRRQYFWEYFFRSAFFGEFGFDDSVRWVATSMLAVGLLFLGVAFLGAWNELLRNLKVALPMFALGGFILLAQVWYRLFASFSSNQDFRFSVPLVLPVFYFMFVETLRLPRVAQACVYAACAVFLLLNLAFLRLLYVL